MVDRPRSNRASLVSAGIACTLLFLTLIGWQNDRLKYLDQARELAARLSAREDPLPVPSGATPLNPSGASAAHPDATTVGAGNTDNGTILSAGNADFSRQGAAVGFTDNGTISNPSAAAYFGKLSNGRLEWSIRTSAGLFSCWRVKTGMACTGPAKSSGATGDTSGDGGATAGPPGDGGTTAGPPSTAGQTGPSSIRIVETPTRSRSTETPGQSPPSGHLIATPRS